MNCADFRGAIAEEPWPTSLFLIASTGLVCECINSNFSSPYSYSSILVRFTMTFFLFFEEVLNPTSSYMCHSFDCEASSAAKSLFELESLVI